MVILIDYYIVVILSMFLFERNNHHPHLPTAHKIKATKLSVHPQQFVPPAPARRPAPATRPASQAPPQARVMGGVLRLVPIQEAVDLFHVEDEEQSTHTHTHLCEPGP